MKIFAFVAVPLGAAVAFGAAYNCTVTSSHGCYVDGGEDPSADRPAILVHEVPQSRSMTKETCAAACWDAGFTTDAYFGVEYGSQCFCGNGFAVESPTKLDDSRCGKTCAGNHSETCGGNYAIEVFQATCSAKPPPPAPAPASMCLPDDLKDSPWCDLSLGFEERAKALVANLTTDEKACLFQKSNRGVPRIKWPGFRWSSEALHGVGAPWQSGMATSWPQVIGVGASFDKQLFWELGNMTSTDARGKEKGVGHTYWTPNINIFRDPRWGRGQETPGEDPVLTASYAENLVKGLQGDDPKYLKVSAGMKHFSAYSQESGRYGYPAVVTKQDMEETYLPAFKAGVEKGKASGIMCSYTAETYGYGIMGEGTQDGAIPSCANKYLMNDLARGEWGFRGYITSDCGAVTGVQNSHHYTTNAHDTVNATLSAGMDVDCGGFMTADVMKNFTESSSDAKSLVDTALEHLFTMQLRLGFADPPKNVPWAGYRNEVINTPEHQALAKRAADESLVLLKNVKSTLPLSAKFKKLVVLGPNANATKTMQGSYAGTAPFLISPCECLSNLSSVECVVPEGCTVGKGSCWNDDTELAVKAADAVVVVIGLDESQERETHDRSNLQLPGEQASLLSETVKVAAGKPVVVLVMSGAMVDLTAAKADPNMQAIMWCGYPGQAGGQAIADAIYGRTNKFGKLPITWYDPSYADEVKLTEYMMHPNVTSGYPGRTHKFYTGAPTYKFGDGLSYTTFERKLQVSNAPNETAFAVAEASVRNTGDRAGDDVLLLFGAPPNAGENGAPRQLLLDFARLHLAVGEQKQTRFELTTEHFALTDQDGDRNFAPGQWKIWLGTDGEAQSVNFAAQLLV